MAFLLDTHTFLWFINGDKKLPKNIRSVIDNIDNKCYLSIASLWEIAIKMRVNKLELDFGFSGLLSQIIDNNFELLDINFKHLLELTSLELHHRDPFDRIIIAQAIEENFTIITKDGNLKLYNIKVLWD